MKENIKIILSTGGTGGHIFPALAVASAIKKKWNGAELLFVGAMYGKEQEFAKNAGLEFHGLNVQGIKGKGLKAIKASFSMLKAIGESYVLLGKFKPDMVVGFGGYACFATVFAAKLRKIPCIIHEQNAIAGLANKVLSYLVDKICLSLPDDKGIFNPKKTVLTGNPIREDIKNISPEYKENYKKNSKDPRKHLLIMGGSLGAASINSLTISLLPKLKLANVKITHQCGTKDYPRMIEAYEKQGFSLLEIDQMVHEFIDDMAEVYTKCDLALCRAGASSIAELSATATPAVFISYPNAANDHQSVNAKILVSQGAALSFSEQEIKQIPLDKIIFDLLADDEKLSQMSKNIYTLARINADENVLDVIAKIIEGKKYA